ncbi:MAG: hypothetical protein OYM47_19995 [Gemmatimonadota bacterium]|nr:hypothetical protein [Gemmatimonadota bacterium]
MDSRGTVAVGLWDAEVSACTIAYSREEDEIRIAFEVTETGPTGFVIRRARGDAVLEPHAPLAIQPESGRKRGPGFMQYEPRDTNPALPKGVR